MPVRKVGKNRWKVGNKKGTFVHLQKRGKDVPMPFGPYLAIAGWIAMVWGERLMDWYWSTMGATPPQG